MARPTPKTTPNSSLPTSRALLPVLWPPRHAKVSWAGPQHVDLGLYDTTSGRRPSWALWGWCLLELCDAAALCCLRCFHVLQRRPGGRRV